MFPKLIWIFLLSLITSTHAFSIPYGSDQCQVCYKTENLHQVCCVCQHNICLNCLQQLISPAGHLVSAISCLSCRRQLDIQELVDRLGLISRIQNINPDLIRYRDLSPGVIYNLPHMELPNSLNIVRTLLHDIIRAPTVPTTPSARDWWPTETPAAPDTATNRHAGTWNSYWLPTSRGPRVEGGPVAVFDAATDTDRQVAGLWRDVDVPEGYFNNLPQHEVGHNLGLTPAPHQRESETLRMLRLQEESHRQNAAYTALSNITRMTHDSHRFLDPMRLE